MLLDPEGHEGQRGERKRPRDAHWPPTLRPGNCGDETYDECDSQERSDQRQVCEISVPSCAEHLLALVPVRVDYAVVDHVGELRSRHAQRQSDQPRERTPHSVDRSAVGRQLLGRCLEADLRESLEL
jgi:hypothetical protein